MAEIDFDGRFFWEGLEQGALLIQHCADCGKLRYPPKIRCLACGSTESGVSQASGRARLFSYTVMYRPPIPGVTLPVTFGLVELEEGVRMVAPLDRAIAQPAAGMALEAVFGPNDLAPAPLRFAARAVS